MTEPEILKITDAVERKIEKTVNGKILKVSEDVQAIHRILERQNEVTDEFIKRHEIDMGELRPFVQGAAGVRLVWKGVVSLGSLAVAWLAIKNFLHL